MRAVILIQATKTGLVDLSLKSRAVVSGEQLVTKLNGNNYFNLNNTTKVTWVESTPKLTDFTIEGWVSLPTKNSGSTDINIVLYANLGGDGDGDFYLAFKYDKSVILYSKSGGSDDFYSVPTSVSYGAPFHFAWVVSNGIKNLYINGVFIASRAIPTYSNGLPSRNQLSFGYTPPNNNLSNIDVGQIIIWDDAKYKSNFTPEFTIYEQAGYYNLSKESLRPFYPFDYNGVIADKVLIKGVPAKRKVCLYLRATNELVATTWSDSAGNYRFENLAPNVQYYVLALDHTRNYNAVIQDMLRAE